MLPLKSEDAKPFSGMRSSWDQPSFLWTCAGKARLPQTGAASNETISKSIP
jgi:hypothetical protein